ncbi:MAG: tyrosine--tRNA ligase [Actinomycetes bacterium]
MSGAEVFAEFRWRGLIAQSTDEAALIGAFDKGPLTAYIGFDPTAPSLHVGNLVVLLVLRRLQLAGHRPIALVGGATGLVGDPSGRSSERTLNDEELVETWVARIRLQLERFLSFDDSPTGALVTNNYDWTKDISALEFLRDIGKHFSVNQMLAKDSVSARLEGGGISYTEFSYQVLQSLDFLELYRRHNCVLQMGGSDQWGNITAGLDLIRRVDQGSAHALTVPLMTKADGGKFGKTASGTIWLDPEMTSPYAFYQNWISTDDRDVVPYLKILTFLSETDIGELAAQVESAPERREAQKALARELTTLVHGADQYQRVEAASKALFGQGELGDLDGATLAGALAEVPRASVPAGELPALIDLMAMTGIVDSKSAARRAIREGGAYLNNVKITDEAFVPSVADLVGTRFLVLRRGKREIGAIEVE